MSTLYIMRGLPGSGKSTKAKEIYDSYPFIQNTLSNGQPVKRIHVCSTDSYFYVNGQYVFDRAALGMYHNWTFHDVVNWMNFGDDVILDNTNIKRKDFQRYIDAAKENGYEVVEFVVGSFDDESILAYHARNQHNVPLDTIKRMAHEFQL